MQRAAAPCIYNDMGVYQVLLKYTFLFYFKALSFSNHFRFDFLAKVYGILIELALKVQILAGGQTGRRK